MRRLLLVVAYLAVAGARGAAADSPAILYRAALGCGDCFWELALAGDPADPDRLTLIGRSGGLRVSSDGGRTWTAKALTGSPFLADPKMLVTPDGTLLLSCLVGRSHPADAGQVRGGGLFQGPLPDGPFSGTVFKDAPATLPPEVRLVADYPKLARDPGSGTLYIASNAVRFADGSVGSGLFVSHDGGTAFTERPLSYQPPDTTRVSPVMAMDVTPDGALRAVVSAGTDGQDRIYLLRFDAGAEAAAVVPGPVVPNLSLGIARVSADTPTAWFVYQGPEMVVDRTPGGAHAGRLYLAWAEPAAVVEDTGFQYGRYGIDYDVRLAWSDDDGETWSEPLRVNDDATAGDQVFPSLGLDAGGVLHVAFLDRRAGPGLAQFDVSYALVEDGRVSSNVRVNEVPVQNPTGGRSVGDYLDMVVAHPTRAYVAYPCGDSGDGPGDACIAAIDPTAVLAPAGTSTTSTSSTTTSTTTSVPATGLLSCLPPGPLPCDDGDACTNDGGTPQTGCTATDRPPTEPGGVLCGVDNLRAIIQAPPEPVCQAGCPRRLERRLAAVSRLIEAGRRAAGRGRCRRKMRAAFRAAHRLDQRIARAAAAGRLGPAERRLCLVHESARLKERAATLAAAYCIPAAMARE